MTTHQETHPRARRGGPFLARREAVVGLVALVLGMLISQGAAEGVTIVGRMAIAAGLGFALGSVPYWLMTAVVIVTAYGF
jgi:hypothetical protein